MHYICIYNKVFAAHLWRGTLQCIPVNGSLSFFFDLLMFFLSI